MRRSHYFGDVKKGRNFNHAHGQFHTPDLQRRPRRPRRLSIMRSVDILAQAMPSAPKELADPRQKAINFPLDNFIPLSCREDFVILAEAMPSAPKKLADPRQKAVNFPLCRDERLPHFDGSAEVRPSSAMRAHVCAVMTDCPILTGRQKCILRPQCEHTSVP